jgi:TonB family protein
VRRLAITIVWTVVLGASASVAVAQTDNTPPLVLEHAEDPPYPPLARDARIEGSVELEFQIDPSGGATSVAVVSGHPVLARPAENAVASWRFVRPAAGFALGKIHWTTFQFSFVEHQEPLTDAQAREVAVAYDSYRFVTISRKLSKVRVEGCVDPDDSKSALPGPNTNSSGDYVELSRPRYQVRLYRNGQVEWEGKFGSKVVGITRAAVGSEESAALLEKFSVAKFWLSCRAYSPFFGRDHQAYVAVTAKIGSLEKEIEVRADAGPPWLGELIREIDTVADTHRWRHGEPIDEPLSNITRESWLGKPTRTALMAAAELGNQDEVAALLSSGAIIDQTDASGWTALMYAAAGDGDLEPLLKAGANPNHKDPQGHTPLMAEATGGFMEDVLLEAGADINAQSKAGLTVLMILATSGDPDLISFAIESGADPTLADSENRTATDYLTMTHCNQGPLRDPTTEWGSVEGRSCHMLNEDDVRASLQILSEAVLNHHQRSSRRR